jgi:hypothetical protein
MTPITSVIAVPFRELPTSMLPSAEARHTCRRPIHRSEPWPLAGHPETMKMSRRRVYFHTSAWKKSSAKFLS